MSDRSYVCHDPDCFFCYEMERLSNGDYREWRFEKPNYYQNRKEKQFKFITGKTTKMKTTLLTLLVAFVVTGAMGQTNKKQFVGTSIHFINMPQDYVEMRFDKDSTIVIVGDTVKNIRAMFKQQTDLQKQLNAANALLSTIRANGGIDPKQIKLHAKYQNEYWLAIGDKRGRKHFKK